MKMNGGRKRRDISQERRKEACQSSSE